MQDMIITALLGAMAGGTLAIALIKDLHASHALRTGQPTHVDASGYRTAGKG